MACSPFRLPRCSYTVNPLLDLGAMSSEQKNREEVRVRRLFLRTATGIDQVESACTFLVREGRVIEASIGSDSCSINVRYALSVATFGELLQQLGDQSYPIADSRWRRFRHWWVSYLDQNARRTMRAPITPCCGDPKEIYAKRRRP